MSRRHADNWSHPGHYLVDPYTWPWHQMVMVMVMNDLLPPPLCNINRPSQSEIQLFQNLTMKIHSRSRSWPSSNLMVTFEVLEFNRYVCFPFRGNRTIFAEILQILYFTLKIQGQGHGQGQTQWSHLSPWVQSIYVCFSFRGSRTIFGWDIANSIFDLENSRSRSWPRSNPMVTFEPLRVQSICLLVVWWQSDHFWLRYSKFHIWPWKI